MRFQYAKDAVPEGASEVQSEQKGRLGASFSGTGGYAHEEKTGYGAADDRDHGSWNHIIRIGGTYDR